MKQQLFHSRKWLTTIICLLSFGVYTQTTHWVTNTDNAGPGSFRQATINAVNGDIVRFNPALIANGSATINLTSTISILNKGISIKGLYNATDTLFISGDLQDYNASSLIVMSNAISGSIDSLVLINCNKRVINFSNIQNVSVQNSVIKNNDSGYDDNGGAMYIWKTVNSNTLNVTINNCIFENNKAYFSTSGLDIYSTENINLIMTNTTIKDNGTELSYNYSANGLKAYSQKNLLFTIENCVIEGNKGEYGAGIGLSAGLQINLAISNSVLKNNTSSSWSNGGTALQLFSTVDSDYIFENCTIEGNTGGDEAISVYGNGNSQMTFENCTIKNNQGSYSGAIRMYVASEILTLNINKCTFNNNNSSNSAAGIDVSGNSQVTVNISNSTLVENYSTDSYGSHVLLVSSWQESALVNIVNSTIQNSTSHASAKMISAYGNTNSSTSIKGSIIMYGSANHNAIDGSPLTSLGYNIFSYSPLGHVNAGANADFINATQAQVNLQSLADNGGNTHTMFPGTGSIAIEAGDPNDLSPAQNGNVTGVRYIGAASATLCIESFGTDEVFACGSYTWINGVTYTANNNSDTYVLTNTGGCDSTVTLNLMFSVPEFSTNVVTACDSYTWIDGNTYTENNTTAIHTLPNIGGCDSTVTLNLTINYSNTGTDAVNACGSYTWIDGNTYTSNNNTTTHVLQNAAGCDSTVTLNLTINQPNSSIDVITACGSHTWIDGNTYTSNNNTATHVLQNAAGCDSTVTLNLTINQPNSGTDIITACGSHTWIDGNTYTANNNTATHVLQNAAGCDSTVTLNLTLSIPDSDVSGPAEVCVNSPTTISLSNSDDNGLYFLRNDANNAIVDGPIAGTGAGLTFNTGNLTQTTTFNILASLPSSSEALDFDGINDGVHVGQIQGITNSVSVEAWIFPKGNVGTTAWDRIFDGNWVNNFTFCSQGGMTNSLNLTMGGGAVITVPNVLVPNQWQHVAFTYDDVSKVVRLYRNGLQIGSATYTGGPRTMTAPHTIGSNAVGTEAMNAIIDEVRLWNTTRTAAQLLNNMNTCLNGDEPGLVLYFNFEDETGNATVTDKTGNGHNGTLVNMDPASDWVGGVAICASCEFEMTETVTVAVANHAAPTGDASQEVCYPGTLNDLTVVGNEIKWYDAASGGNLLPNSTTLIPAGQYFASQTINGCESTNRLAVAVTLNNPNAPTGDAEQTLCNAGTLADLMATGNNIQWYDAATGGNVLPETTELVNNTSYFASQTVDGCESANRFGVSVNVASVVDQTVNQPATPNLCNSGSSQISMASSEVGVNYSLRNDDDNSLIDGPFNGTGESINFNTGTISSTTTYHVLAERAPNTSMQFDGVNDFINVGNPTEINFTGAFSIETWVKIGAFDKVWQAIAVKGDNSWRLHRSGNSNHIAFGTDGLSNIDLTTNATFNDGNWHHVVATYDGTHKRIYVDGNLDVSLAVTGTLNLNTTALLIGETFGYNRYFNGNIDELRLWNHARTQAQIQENMNIELVGNESGLVLYYKFNELTGTGTVIDASTNGLDGTLTNMNNATVRQGDVPFQTPTCSFQLSDTKTVSVHAESVAPTVVNSLYNMCHGGSTTLEIEGGSLSSGSDWEWFSGSCNSTPIGTGSSLEVSPNANTTYYARASQGTACPPSDCESVVVNLPATSTNLSLDGEHATCFVNQNGWVHFYNSAGNLIASIKSNGQDLGNVQVTSHVANSPYETTACDNVNNASFFQANLQRTFVITPENQPTDPVQVRLYLLDDEIAAYQTAALATTQNPHDDIATISDLNMTKVSGGTGSGDPTDFCGSNATAEFLLQDASGNINDAATGLSGFTATSYLEFTIDGFSEFFPMNTNNSALPVSLTSFSANCLDDQVQLSWTTASELNASHYVLESSRDGFVWNEITKIDAAGTTNQMSNYNHAVSNTGNITYFRLVQVDNDGTQEIFGPISSNCTSENNLMTVHPNPASESFLVTLQSTQTMENTTIDLVDMSGRVIQSQNVNIHAGSTMLNFDVKAIQPGAYIIRVLGENDKFTPIRVVKM